MQRDNLVRVDTIVYYSSVVTSDLECISLSPPQLNVIWMITLFTNNEIPLSAVYSYMYVYLIVELFESRRPTQQGISK